MNIIKLKEFLTPYQFAGKITAVNAIECIETVDKEFANFAITNQTRRLIICPYTLIFLTNPTIVINPFIILFENLKKIVGAAQNMDRFSPRMVVKDNNIVIDLMPSPSSRSKYHLYTMSKKDLIFDNRSFENLAYYDEIEIKFISGNDFRLTDKKS